MKVVYNIRLRLKTALHINAGIGGDGRRVFIKSNDEVYIPGTTLKGILRSNMERLVRATQKDYVCSGKENAERACDCIMCQLFGKAGFQPSRIIVDNLYLEDNAVSGVEIRTNNAINRYTRKTVDGALVTQETVSATGEPVFIGNIIAYYPDNNPIYEKYIINALNMIDSIGSSKSRGLGLVEIEVSKCTRK